MEDSLGSSLQDPFLIIRQSRLYPEEAYSVFENYELGRCLEECLIKDYKVYVRELSN